MHYADTEITEIFCTAAKRMYREQKRTDGQNSYLLSFYYAHLYLNFMMSPKKKCFENKRPCRRMSRIRPKRAKLVFLCAQLPSSALDVVVDFKWPDPQSSARA